MKDDNYDSILLDYEGPDPDRAELEEQKVELAAPAKRVPQGGAGVKTLSQVMAE